MTTPSSNDRFSRDRFSTVGITLALALPMLIPAWPAFAQIAATLLNPLVSSWIRSQVAGVDNLTVEITGTDQEILNGQIPTARIAGSNLKYQGFQVSQVQLAGQNIRLNVGSAMKGEPLQLQAPVPVQVNLRLTEADFNQTLQSPLIQKQLAQATVTLPIGNETVPFAISQPKVKLEKDRIRIDAQVATANGPKVPVTLSTRLGLQGQNRLILLDPAWISNGQSIPIPSLNNLAIDLGPQVKVKQLNLSAGLVTYSGDLTILPTAIAPAQ